MEPAMLMHVGRGRNMGRGWMKAFRPRNTRGRVGSRGRIYAWQVCGLAAIAIITRRTRLLRRGGVGWRTAKLEARLLGRQARTPDRAASAQHARDDRSP